jgi:hypothetical protein
MLFSEFRQVEYKLILNEIAISYNIPVMEIVAIEARSALMEGIIKRQKR